MKFNDFSNEILLSIAHYVGGYGSQPQTDTVIRASKDLFAFALCCHRMYDVAEPIIYGTFWQKHKEGLLSFTCRLLARPDLARRTKLLHFSVPIMPTESVLDVSELAEED